MDVNCPSDITAARRTDVCRLIDTSQVLHPADPRNFDQLYASPYRLNQLLFLAQEFYRNLGTSGAVPRDKVLRLVRAGAIEVFSQVIVDFMPLTMPPSFQTDPVCPQTVLSDGTVDMLGFLSTYPVVFLNFFCPTCQVQEAAWLIALLSTGWMYDVCMRATNITPASRAELLGLVAPRAQGAMPPILSKLLASEIWATLAHQPSSPSLKVYYGNLVAGCESLMALCLERGPAEIPIA